VGKWIVSWENEGHAAPTVQAKHQELIVTQSLAARPVPAATPVQTYGRIVGRRISMAMLLLVAGTSIPAFGQAEAAKEVATPAAGSAADANAKTDANADDKLAAKTGEKPAENASLLADFIHYVRIQNYDLAEAMGAELAGRGLTNTEFVVLVEGTGDVMRFEESVQRAMRVPQLEKVAATLAKANEDGKLERARNPEQVARNIDMLTGTDRGRRLAEERLVYAGEYAMPQLLEAFLDRSKATRQAAVVRVIVGMGRQGVIPLATAMMKVTPVKQEAIADLLGMIPHRTSLPFLRDLADITTVELVRTAANRAIGRVAGTDTSASSNDAPTLYRNLAEIYYAQRSDVTSFPADETQLLWNYEPSTGLIMTAIKTPVFHEAMAMRLAERALEIESKRGTASADTLALWVSSNFSREIDSPAKYENPSYITTGTGARRSAEYYAVAAGADVAQRVLGRAIQDRDTPLARRAIVAIEKTAGSKDLWAASSGAQTPLQAALTYPNRRVQFDAALALAAAGPKDAFAGSDRVIPTLASSVRGATSQYAVVLTSEPEQYQSARATLIKMGFTVLPQGRAMSELASPLSEAPAIDLVVSAGITGDAISAVVDDVRGQSKTLATPILVLTNPQSYTELSRRYASDSGVFVRQNAIGQDAITESIKQLVERSSGGGITEVEATDYAARSLSALRDLAVSGNTVLSAGDASAPLIAALSVVEGETKLKVAEILSRIDQDRAQRAIMDAALAASGAQKVTLIGFVSESGKRFGNFLDAGQVTKLTQLASTGNDAEATAAAGLIGALNLARTQLVPMLIKQ